MMTSDHCKVLDWITKDYDTWEYWKRIGMDLHIACNGDSALTRYRLADLMRRSMSKLPHGPIEFQTYNDDCTGKITITIDPSEITASNEVYGDWLRLADYMLLAAAAPWPKLDEENQRRRAIHEQYQRGYEARMIVEAVAEYSKDHPRASEKEIRTALNRDGREVLQIHIQQAKKIPVPGGNYGREIVEVPPQPPAELKPYSNLYF